MVSRKTILTWNFTMDFWLPVQIHFTTNQMSRPDYNWPKRGADIFWDLHRNALHLPILYWTHTTKWNFNLFFSIPMDILIQYIHELLYSYYWPRTIVKQFILETSEKALTSWVVWRTPLLGHRTDQTWIFHSFNPPWPTIMCTPIGMHIIVGRSPFFKVVMAVSNMVLTSSALGEVPIVHATGRPSKQSMTGER